MADTNNVTKVAMASLRKRGITFTERELHLAVLYGMVRSACYKMLEGEVDLTTTSSKVDEAVRRFHELENPSSEDDMMIP